MRRRVLIIVYKFPPMGGVGSRRWAKFAKYLAKRGYEVHVLTADGKGTDKVNWLNDVGDNHIIVHRFKSFYPSFLLGESFNIFGYKIKRIIRAVLSRTLFYIDNAQYDAKPILSKAKIIIKDNGIKNVIASGHPVSINYIATYLKIDLPQINLIQDFRDNWNDLDVYQYGNKSGISKFKNKEKIAYQEFFTLYYSDYIINVSNDLTNQLKRKNKNMGDKFITITNGFDYDDFRIIKRKPSGKNNKITLIYTGSLFNHRIDAIYLLLDAVMELNDDYINNHFKIKIFSNFDPAKIKEKYTPLMGKIIHFNGLIGPKQIIKEIERSSHCLSINAKFASYAFGTKIFDYMGLNKRILHISEGGELFDLLKEKKQLVCRYDIEEVRQVLLQLKREYLNGCVDNITDYSDYAIHHLTKKLEELFFE